MRSVDTLKRYLNCWLNRIEMNQPTNQKPKMLRILGPASIQHMRHNCRSINLPKCRLYGYLA